MTRNTRQVLRRRIRGIRETAKITRATELIAAARMRRAEQRAMDARPYAAELTDLMALTLVQLPDSHEHPLFARPDDGLSLVVHVTTDKGLCGGLNARLNHTLGEFALLHGDGLGVVTVGRKGRDFALRSHLRIVAEFAGLRDVISIAQLRPLCRLVTDLFVRGEIDHVHLCYPQLISVMSQRPTMQRILPIPIPESEGVDSRETLFEPEAGQVLEQLLVRYVEANIYHACVELVACEHAARMVAMHAATTSANDLVSEMTAELHKSRQAAITEEICDVTAGVEILAREAMNE